MSLKVWDPLLRLFHWSLACFFLVAYFLEGDWIKLHAHAGYTVALLVMFRLIWGFLGTTHARFSSFMPSPQVFSDYLRDFLHRRAKPHTGHDPLGALMIVSLLVSLLVTTFLGMSLFAMQGSGPLPHALVSNWSGSFVESAHDFFANLTMGLVVVHIAGVLLTSFLHRENLIAAMITGRKKGGL